MTSNTFVARVQVRRLAGVDQPESGAAGAAITCYFPTASGTAFAALEKLRICLAQDGLTLIDVELCRRHLPSGDDRDDEGVKRSQGFRDLPAREYQCGSVNSSSIAIHPKHY